jgi:hypothetical protein
MVIDSKFVETNDPVWHNSSMKKGMISFSDIDMNAM